MNLEKPPLGNQFDTIIHIGAGRGRELGEYISSGARRIVLVDADRMSAARLRVLVGAAAQTDSAIEVIEAAVAGKEKDAELRIYNLERVSGIRQAEALKDVFPGLRLVRSTNLRTQEAVHLIEGLKIDPGKANALVIDAPGEEYAILANLQAKGALDLFSSIRVPVSRRPLYTGAAGANDVVKLLESAGYFVQHGGDVEWPILQAIWLRLRSDVDDIKRLELKVAELSKENTSLSNKNTNLTDELTKLQELSGYPVDVADRKSMFQSELHRCESQVDLLKDLLRNGIE